MELNPTKSDAILFGTSQRLKTMSSLSSVKLDDDDDDDDDNELT